MNDFLGMVQFAAWMVIVWCVVLMPWAISVDEKYNCKLHMVIPIRWK